MKLNIFIILFFVFLITSFCFSQSKKVDSLISVSQSNKQDTSTIKALNTLTMYFEYKDTLKAWTYNRQAMALGLKLQWIPGLAKTYLITGWLYQDISKYEAALDYMNKSLRSYHKLFLKNKGDLTNLANISGCYNNLGNVYTNMGNYSKALQNYILGLKKIEKILQNNPNKTDYLRKVAACYINLGSVYAYMNDNKNALNYFLKAKDMSVPLKDSNVVARCLINMGIVYKRDSLKNESVDCYQKALKIFDAQKDLNGVCLCLHNLGLLYFQVDDYTTALEYEMKALEMNKKLGNKQDESLVLGVIGEILMKQNKIADAEKYVKDALKISEEIDAMNDIKTFSLVLSQLYAKKKDFTLAYKFHLKYSDTKDSIFNLENSKQFSEMKEKYESDKKQQQIVIQKTQLEKKDVEVKQQKTMRNAFIAGFLLMLALAVVIFNSFRQKKKANIIIQLKNRNLEQANAEIAAQRDEIESQRNIVTDQKNEIEEIHQELKDSIYYANRIQHAVLPAKESILRIIDSENCFILYKPKDIVSGDFYFIDKRRNILLLAVVDCTGHGVPGGFMSMLGIAFLNEIIARDDVQTASKVLDELRDYIIKSLQQKGESGEQKDGMDMAICAIDVNTLEMQFAGANNPCWIVNSRQPCLPADRVAVSSQELTANSQLLDRVKELSDSEPACPDNLSRFIGKSVIELIELKPDKQPIGIHSNMQPFTNQKYQLQKDDIIYLMSDGFEDQFGGPNRKKFLAKNIKNLLTANSQKPMADQKQILETTISDWIGEAEQIDDITILGIKI